jgi:hypothetical protein
MEKVTKEEAKKGTYGKHKKMLFDAFKTIGDNEGLKINLTKMKMTQSGIRYILKAWNKNHPDKKLAPRRETIKNEIIIYIYPV